MTALDAMTLPERMVRGPAQSWDAASVEEAHREPAASNLYPSTRSHLEEARYLVRGSF